MYIKVCCYSEKKEVSLEFGYEDDESEHSLEEIGDSWFFEGIVETFWENSYEFEEEIKEVDKTIEEEPTITVDEAIYKVFGLFKYYFEINGKREESPYDIDINGIMVALLSNLSNYS